MNLSSWVSDTSLPAAKVHFFPHSISVQAAHNKLPHSSREIKIKAEFWWIRFIPRMIDERGYLTCHKINLQGELRELSVALKVLQNVTLAAAA